MGKKTYYVHLNWSDYPGKTSKLSIPSKWDTTKPVEALIELFVDAYNAKVLRCLLHSFFEFSLLTYLVESRK